MNLFKHTCVCVPDHSPKYTRICLNMCVPDHTVQNIHDLFKHMVCVPDHSLKYTCICLNICVCVYRIRQSQIYMKLFKHVCVPDHTVQNIHESF
jgi:hypothetical protein